MHIVVLTLDPLTGHTYCAECGRNVWPARKGGSPATGVWPDRTPATTAAHLYTSRAALARRGF